MKGLTTIILTIFYGPLMACVCNGTESVKESFDKYSLIFHGRVIDKSVVSYSTTLKDEQLKKIRENLKSDQRRLERFEGEQIQKITFQILKMIKGDSMTSTVTIFTDYNTSCDIDFKLNKEYLIYGTRKAFNDNKYLKQADTYLDLIKERLYWTHFCSRTRLYNEKEKKELIELKNG